jgi:uncharacterized membrane protein
MLKRIFITGLAAIIPLVISVYVIVGLFHFADGILGKFINQYLKQYLGRELPGLGIVIAILIIFILGILIQISRMRFFRWFSDWFSESLLKIPLFNKIYLPVKRIVNFLFFSPRKNFQSAVLVEYPRKGLHTLGFLTNEAASQFQDKTGKKLHNVFIPSSPSPLTGFTIMVDEKDLVFLDISVEDALALVVSGGLINP